MSDNHEQLVIDGFYDSTETTVQLEPTGLSVEESKLMLTSLARHRLSQIIRGDIKDSRDLNNNIDSLQNQ